MSEILQHILDFLKLKTKYLTALVKQNDRMKRISKLIENTLRDLDISEFEVKEVMIFKKWYMIWKFSEESVTKNLTEVFTMKSGKTK